MQQQDNHEYPFLYQRQTCHQVQPNQATYQKRQKCQPATYLQEVLYQRSEERFSRNAETDLVCRLLLEKKKKNHKTNITTPKPLSSLSTNSTYPKRLYTTPSSHFFSFVPSQH